MSVPWGVKGVYVLLIEVSKAATVTVGALGTIEFPEGVYAYVGSALGPGGILARVCRHVRREKRLKWHIDYLLSHPSAHVVGVAFKPCDRREEESLVLTVSQFGDFHASGFGASDTGLPSHLILVGNVSALLERLLSEGFRYLDFQALSNLCSQRPRARRSPQV